MNTIRAATETTSLGRYHVVRRLAAGGMADVLIARTNGIEGFERHVVIKRIHAELLDEERYIKMFLDEARLAASLHHQNIVQVNDIGEEDGKYFFAMEYVHGEDARNLLVEASRRRQQIPIEHVIAIVTGAAAGLHHAHEQRGPDRNPLHIVHRDVSPANILVGFDGSVKVADFGIALAAHRAEQTQSGVLKGKVAYMSPEQCNCERVDRRSDVFSLGIVLYELATVHPCFAGDTDFMTMSAIVAGRFTRPSKLSAAVTPALEAIILKALAISPADRYQTADELCQALEHYAAAERLRTSTTALADYMTAQFGTRALPWLEGGDDDEPELTVSQRRPPALIVDDELAIPVEPSGRLVKQTLPLRALKASIPMRASGHDAPLPLPLPLPLADAAARSSVPAAAGGSFVPAAAGSSVRAAAGGPAREPEPQPRPVIAVSAAELVAIALERAQSTARARRWWLLGALAALLVTGLSLVLVSVGDDSRPVANTAERRTRPHVTPLPAPTFTPPSFTPPSVEPHSPDAKAFSPRIKPARLTKVKRGAAPDNAGWKPNDQSRK